MARIPRALFNALVKELQDDQESDDALDRERRAESPWSYA